MSERVLKLLFQLFGPLLFTLAGSRGIQGLLLGPMGLVQYFGFESAKLVSAFLFCLAKD